MAATVADLQVELASTQQRLVLSEQHGVKLADALDKLRSDTDRTFRETQARSEEAIRQATAQGGGRKEDVYLIDVKTMHPGTFAGKASESFKNWSKKLKAFCNGRKDGFRLALETAERETQPIDQDTLRWHERG